MSAPEGSWEDSNELIAGGLIAVEQYEVMAGMAYFAGGLLPCVGVKVMGVLSEHVGDPDAPRQMAMFLLPADVAERFSTRVMEAVKARPS